MFNLKFNFLTRLWNQGFRFLVLRHEVKSLVTEVKLFLKHRFSFIKLIVLSNIKNLLKIITD